MKANDLFMNLFSMVDSILSIEFQVFEFSITLWGMFFAGVIVLFLARVLFAYIT